MTKIVNIRRTFEDAQFEADMDKVDQLQAMLNRKVEHLSQYRNQPPHIEAAIDELRRTSSLLSASAMYLRSMYFIDWSKE